MSDFDFTWGLPELDAGHVRIFGFMLDYYAELGITRQEMLCIVHLARYHFNTVSGESRPSLATVAKQMGYSDRSRVSDLVRSLEGKGMLIITRRPGLPSIYDASLFARAALTQSVAEKRNTAAEEGRALQRTGSIAPQRTGGVRPSAHEEHEEEEKDKQQHADVSPSWTASQIVDLDEIADEASVPRNKVEVQCEVCGAQVTQRMDKCPDCKRPMVWFNSKTWRNKFGSPRKAELRHKKWARPGDPLGIYLFNEMGVEFWIEEEHARRWKKAISLLPREDIKMTISYVKVGKGTVGYGGVKYVLNILQKKIVEHDASNAVPASTMQALPPEYKEEDMEVCELGTVG